MTDKEKEIFDLLKGVAMEDGIIKVDETKIISHAMRSAISFDWYLEKAMEDGVIDDEEKKKLEILRKRIYQEAKDVAERDDIISEDEAILLAELSKKLNDYKDFENLPE